MLGLSKVKGKILVLPHVGDARLHGEEEESEKVKKKDGPKDGNVKEGEKGADDRNQDGLCEREP